MSTFGTPKQMPGKYETKKHYVQLSFHYPLAKQILTDSFTAWCDQNLDAQSRGGLQRVTPLPIATGELTTNRKAELISRP